MFCIFSFFGTSYNALGSATKAGVPTDIASLYTYYDYRRRNAHKISSTDHQASLQTLRQYAHSTFEYGDWLLMEVAFLYFAEAPAGNALLAKFLFRNYIFDLGDN